MIEAKGSYMGNKILMRIEHPENKQPIIKEVESESEAYRVIYFVNRDYMLAKLNKWLKQRTFTYDPIVKKKVAELQVLLEYHKNVDFFNLCNIIKKHKASFEFVAPGPRSEEHYHYYKTSIVPILDDAYHIKHVA